MSDRDRQNPYDRSQQYGSSQRGGDYDSPSQANQWQSDSYRQQGGDWQQDAGHRHDDDYARGSHYQGGSQGYGSHNYGDRNYGGNSYGRGGSQDFDRGGSQDYGRSRSQSYRSQLNDDDLRNDQREASRNYNQARGRYGQSDYRSQDRNWQQGSSYSQRGGFSGYAGRDYDASGGNDFGSFTSEDFGGRDFSNRGGGLSGGMRSSESYRPSYGLSSWTRGNDDNDGRLGRNEQSRGSGREDYGSWRQYGESRGFFAKAGDEIASWFGDEDASRRRDQDHRQDERQNRAQGGYQSHRGRGPSDYTRSDERIREDANDRLTHDDDVDATHITVSVKDGELTLNGTVESRQAKRRAEDAVEHISGVKHVQNNLRVQERSSSTSSYGSSGGNSAGNWGSTSGSTAYGSNTGQSSGLTGQGSVSSASGTTETGSTALGTSGSSTTGGTSSATGATGSTTSSSGSTGTGSSVGSNTPASTSSTTRQGEKTT